MPLSLEGTLEREARSCWRRQASHLEAGTVVVLEGYFASFLGSNCHGYKRESFCLVRIHGDKFEPWFLVLICGPHWPITMYSPVCRKSLT